VAIDVIAFAQRQLSLRQVQEKLSLSKTEGRKPDAPIDSRQQTLPLPLQEHGFGT